MYMYNNVHIYIYTYMYMYMYNNNTPTGRPEFQFFPTYGLVWTFFIGIFILFSGGSGLG